LTTKERKKERRAISVREGEESQSRRRRRRKRKSLLRWTFPVGAVCYFYCQKLQAVDKSKVVFVSDLHHREQVLPV